MIPLILYTQMFMSILVCQMHQGRTYSGIAFNISRYYRPDIYFIRNIANKQLDLLMANQLFRAQGIATKHFNCN